MWAFQTQCSHLQARGSEFVSTSEPHVWRARETIAFRRGNWNPSKLERTRGAGFLQQQLQPALKVFQRTEGLEPQISALPLACQPQIPPLWDSWHRITCLLEPPRLHGQIHMLFQVLRVQIQHPLTTAAKTALTLGTRPRRSCCHHYCVFKRFPRCAKWHNTNAPAELS